MTEQSLSHKIHSDLISANSIVYEKCGFLFSNVVPESESKEYGACTFTLNKLNVKFRVAKITPTKAGQFVTLWKRDATGITCPHDSSDAIDLFVISVRDKNKFGQFIFPKVELLKQGILSTPKKEGKRGFRVYTPWDHELNKQAQKTQNWQLNFFLEINSAKPLDKERVILLYSQK